MLRSTAKWGIAWVLGIIANGSAIAEKPAWAVEALYSEPSRKVQFVMLAILRDNASLAGHLLIAANGTEPAAERNVYRFPNDVRANAAGRTILVATEDFASVALVRPDFVVPNGFFFSGSGLVTVTDATGNSLATEFRYSGANPEKALAWRRYDWCDDEWIVPNSYDCGVLHRTELAAINNAGESAVLVPDGLQNFGGVWWNAPAGSEPGWAIAVEHQGDIVVAAWATYDANGAPTWFVIPRADQVVTDESGQKDSHTFAGPIYRMLGPPFGATPFDASTVHAARVGQGGFHFPRPSDHGVGTFWYDFGGSQSGAKAIALQYFGDWPSRKCVRGEHQGLWWNPAESGWGIYVAHRGPALFAIWLAYGGTGEPTWLTAVAGVRYWSGWGAASYRGIVYRTTGPAWDAATFDSAEVKSSAIGEVVFDFASFDRGTFSHTVDGITQTRPVERQVFAKRSFSCD